MNIEHKTIVANGLTFHVAVAGSGPLVLLAHGFPELWYCWRHQIKALVEAGFRVAAPDQRGYGESDAPHEIEKYSMFHLVGDLVGIVQALGEEKAHLIAHDWGAGVAWNAAVMRPDIFHTVACISVPYQERNPDKQPIPTFKAIAERKNLGEFYMVRFQEPGLAEFEFEADLDLTFRQVIHGSSSNAPQDQQFQPFLQPGQKLVRPGPGPDLPDWMPKEDLEVFIKAYEKSGFRGPLNWYRNLDLNWELMAPFQGTKIHQPVLYITGELDHVRIWGKVAENKMPELVPGLKDVVIIPDAGHWVHQEKPDEVNAALLKFLSS